MTVTNDERHEVATRLRDFENLRPTFKDSVLCGFLEALDVGYLDWEGVCNHLADLIEPEPERTCRFNVVIENIPGKKKRANICECSNCGYRCAYGFIIDEYFQCCPNCGAKVLND